MGCRQRAQRLLQIAESVLDQRTVSGVFVAGLVMAGGQHLDRGAICAILSR
jgi:hypothetical protein